ncbi:MAG: TRM11 family methyltransferase [Planctomycetota bacterium]
MNPRHTDDWHRLYGESWKGAIEDDAFAHPAKFSRGLIRRIYEHMLSEDWLCPGATVLDPFGGVALLNAMESGLNWIGMELEERFVLMGNQNIQRWEAVLRARGNGHGRGYLYHGDSRYLALLLSARMAGCCAHAGGNDPHPEHIQGGTYHGVGIQGAVSSPPYSGNIKSDHTHEQRDERKRMEPPPPNSGRCGPAALTRRSPVLLTQAYVKMAAARWPRREKAGLVHTRQRHRTFGTRSGIKRTLGTCVNRRATLRRACRARRMRGVLETAISLSGILRTRLLLGTPCSQWVILGGNCAMRLSMETQRRNWEANEARPSGRQPARC